MPTTTREGLLEEWFKQMYSLRCAFAGETPISPIPLPDVTTVDGMLEGIVREADGAFVNVAVNAGIYHDFVEGAYILDLPAKLYRWYGLKKVGGRTVSANQIEGDVGSTYWKNYSNTYTTVAFNDGVATVTVIDDSSSTSYMYGVCRTSTHVITSGHVYYYSYDIKSNKDGYSFNDEVVTAGQPSASTPTAGEWVHFAAVKSATKSSSRFLVSPSPTSEKAGLVFDFKNAQLIDLTQMFGAGNEPALEQCEIIFKNLYPQNTGVLVSAGVTQIVSKDSSNTVIDTLTIPAEVTALPGYGWSCPNHTNYVDFEEKKYYQAVGSRAYESGDENDATVITDGTTTHYALDDIIETDLEAYLVDVDLKVEAGGTITFDDADNDYNIPVPVQVDYIGK